MADGSISPSEMTGLLAINTVVTSAITALGAFLLNWMKSRHEFRSKDRGDDREDRKEDRADVQLISGEYGRIVQHYESRLLALEADRKRLSKDVDEERRVNITLVRDNAKCNARMAVFKSRLVAAGLWNDSDEVVYGSSQGVSKLITPILTPPGDKEEGGSEEGGSLEGGE